MDTLYERVYGQCPVWAQNILLSLYGYRINRIRYGGSYSAYYEEYVKRLKFTKNQLSELQNKQLQEVIKQAVEFVPYYRNQFEKSGLSASDIYDVSDLKKIPVLDKGPVRENPNQFVNECIKKSNLIKIHTTGTTGTPLNIYCDAGSRQRNFAYYNRFLWQNGIKHKRKRATFGGRIIIPSEQSVPPYWRYSYFQKNMLLSSYHISDATIPIYIDQLIKYKPAFIDTYPSSLYNIAKYANLHGIDLNGITGGITTSAETLYREQRQVIESAFGVPVYDQYGAAEMCVFLGQCKEGSYHIHSDYGVVELLREDGSTADIGEEAEIVCTGFVNRVMPLIRYRIGDRGVLSNRLCKCGSVFPVMDKLLGRVDDVIITPDGRKVGRLSPVLKGFPVKEVQYVQNNRNNVDVLIVKDLQYAESTEILLVTELRKRLGNKITINIEYVPAISRGEGGKLKSVISSVR